MKWWQGFGLSLLVALGLHAVVLLVPLVAERGDTATPTIEVSLFSLPAGPGTEDSQPAAAGSGGGGPAPAPAVPSAAAPAPAAAVTPSPQGPPSNAQDAPAPVTAAADPGAEGTAAAASPGAGAGSGGTGTDAGVGESGGGPGALGGGQGGPVGGPGSAGSEASMPQARIEILPEYPRSARKAGWEGVVTISVTIDESGKVVSAEIVVSSGHRSLDQAALEALRRTTYYPVLRKGKPVPARFRRPYRFTLN